MIALTTHKWPVASVPFEAASLLGTKIREEDRKRLALLHNFTTGNCSTYILAWRDLPNVVPMAAFDAKLHEKVYDLEMITPSSIQKAACKLRGLGFAGPQAKMEEFSRRKNERRRIVRISAELVRRLFVSICPQFDASSQQMTRSSLQNACREKGLQPQRVTDQLNELAHLVHPIGLGSKLIDGTAGPLRIRTDQIGHFAKHCIFRISVAGTSEADQACYRAAADAAIGAQGVASRVLHLADESLNDLPRTLADWESQRQIIAGMLRHLEDVLDGWEYVLGLHAGTSDFPQITTTKATSLWALVQDLPGKRYWLRPTLRNDAAGVPRRSFLWSGQQSLCQIH